MKEQLRELVQELQKRAIEHRALADGDDVVRFAGHSGRAAGLQEARTMLLHILDEGGGDE